MKGAKTKAEIDKKTLKSPSGKVSKVAAISGKVKKPQSKYEIVDERFAAAQTDPRFHRFPKAKKKVEIDERFSGMLRDKDFQFRHTVDKRGRKLAKNKRKEDMRKYYRLQDEEADWGVQDADAKQPQGDKSAQDQIADQGLKPKAKPIKAKAKAVSSGESSEEDSEEELDEDRQRDERWARARGLIGPEDSSEEDDQDTDDSQSNSDLDDDAVSEGDEEVDLEEWGVGAWAGNPDEAVEETEDSTRRLAIVDLDWSKIKASDIFVMLQSFLAKGQRIEKVTVYPSDYGLERMADEARFGPKGLTTVNQSSAAQQNGGETEASGVANGGTKKRSGVKKGKAKEMSAAERKELLTALNEEESDPEDDASDGEGETDSLDEEAASGLSEEHDSEAESDGLGAEEGSGPENKLGTERRRTGLSSTTADDSKLDKKARRRLQMYERSRLRYYYAIVECQDVATANQLYNECNGMEFEHSANLFDIRYVPDEQDFSQRQIKDEATEIPAGYKPPEVGAAPMLHTNPKLTWDADDEGRKKALIQRVSKDKLRDDDFKAYLGSESEDEDNEARAQESGAAERYKQLLTGVANGKSGHKDWLPGKTQDASDEEQSDDEEDAKESLQGVREDKGMEMEVTFGGGLDDLSHKLRLKQEEKASKKADTIWEAYLKRRREKKQAAKHRSKNDSDDDLPSDGDPAEEDPFFKHEADAFDDPFFKDAGDAEGRETADPNPVLAKDRKRKRKEREEKLAESEAEKQRKARLEMLMLNDAAPQMHAHGVVAEDDERQDKGKVKLSRKARIAAKRAEKRARRQQDSDNEEAPQHGEVQAGTTDTRFAAMLENPDFAMDPTDPRYKASAATANILKEAAKRRSKRRKSEAVEEATDSRHEQIGKPGEVESEKPANLQQLAASLKRKAKRSKF